MRVQARATFVGLVPKDGLSDDQCEDFAAASADGLVFAVSDGATHSIHAKLWAKCLVEHFQSSPTLKITDEWLVPPSKRFFGSIDVASMPWHAMAKLNEGAFATICGVIIDDVAATHAGVAVGDSCMIRWVPGEDPVFFPDYDSEDLQLDPFLLCNLPERNQESLARVRSFGPVPLAMGLTVYFLFTDAVARWVLEKARMDDGLAPLIDRLDKCRTDEDFQELVRAARADGMRNDDCALVIVEVEAIPEETDAAASDAD